MKTVKAKLVKVGKQVQSIAKNAKAKVVKAAKAVKEAAFEVYTQAYRVWRTLDESGYCMQGHGTICNLRKVSLRKVADQGKGQSVILHRGDHGYGYTVGKLIGSDTIHAGFVQVQFTKQQIVGVFKDYSSFVKYVVKHGEMNIGSTAKYRTLSTGDRYSLYTNGKQVLRHESAGRASGRYHDFQTGGKLFEKFESRKLA